MKSRRILPVLLCLVIALTSFLGLAPWMRSPDTHRQTIESLEHKQKEVMTLSAATAAAATVVASIPGDATTPIGQEIANLASYFMIALCAVLLEKYMVTILGFAACRYLIPIAMLFLAIYFLSGSFSLRRIATKLLAFAICIMMIVPVSVKISGMIEDTYKAETGNPVTGILSQAEGLEIEEKETQAETEAAPETEAANEATGFFDRLSNLKDSAQEIIEDTTEAVKGFDLEEAKSEAKTMLNNFLEATAVFLLTSCVVPVLVLLIFVWLLKIILEVDISNMWDKGMGMNPGKKKRRGHHGSHEHGDHGYGDHDEA